MYIKIWIKKKEMRATKKKQHWKYELKKNLNKLKIGEALKKLKTIITKSTKLTAKLI